MKTFSIIALSFILFYGFHEYLFYVSDCMVNQLVRAT